MKFKSIVKKLSTELDLKQTFLEYIIERTQEKLIKSGISEDNSEFAYILLNKVKKDIKEYGHTVPSQSKMVFKSFKEFLSEKNLQTK